MKRLRRGIAIGAALSFLALGAPVDGAAAAPEDPPPSQAQARKAPSEFTGRAASLNAMRSGRLGCGDVITRSTALTADVGPCDGNGIIIGADNIMLNLNGHTISGTPGVGDGNQAGVRLPFRSGVTVTGQPGSSGRQGTVTGFDAGVVINGGSGNTVENLLVSDNIGPAELAEQGGTPIAELGDGIVMFNSARNKIQNNIVSHNGHYDGIAMLGIGSDGNIVEGNVVEETVGIDHRVLIGVGVIANSFLDLTDIRRGESLYENDVLRNVIRNNHGAGISNISNVRGQVVGNRVENNASAYYANLDAFFEDLPAHGIGIQAGEQATQETEMVVEDNDIVHNGLNGIYLRSHGNRVQSNRVVESGFFGIYIFTGKGNVIRDNVTGSSDYLDIQDDSGLLYTGQETCLNEWFGNTWGPVSPFAASFGLEKMYYPDCTATGGNGPNPPPSG